jgi:hypothetical protein
VLEWWISKQWHLLWAVGGEEWYTCIENQQNWRAVQDLKFWVSSLYYYLDCSSYSFSAPQAITHVSLQKGHCLQWTRVYPSSPTPHNGEADRHNERASAHYISPNPACFIPIMEGCNANFWGLEPFYTKWNLKVISQR